MPEIRSGARTARRGKAGAGGGGGRPHIKQMQGGHRFRLTAQDDSTRIDHELEMRPKGAFVFFAPMMGMIGRKNLRDTANALQARLEK